MRRRSRQASSITLQLVPQAGPEAEVGESDERLFKTHERLLHSICLIAGSLQKGSPSKEQPLSKWWGGVVGAQRAAGATQRSPGPIRKRLTASSMPCLMTYTNLTSHIFDTYFSQCTNFQGPALALDSLLILPKLSFCGQLLPLFPVDSKQICTHSTTSDPLLYPGTPLLALLGHRGQTTLFSPQRHDNSKFPFEIHASTHALIHIRTCPPHHLSFSLSLFVRTLGLLTTAKTAVRHYTYTCSA